MTDSILTLDRISRVCYVVLLHAKCMSTLIKYDCEIVILNLGK